MRWFNNIILWCKYHFTKDFFRILKKVLKSYPFDYGYMYEIEKAELQERWNYFNKTRRFEGVEYVLRDIKICISLLEIICGERDLMTMDGEMKFIDIDDNTSQLDCSDLKYTCNVNVNLKNIDRFVPVKKHQKMYISYPDELYLLKAKHLYYKIRAEKSDYWWD